MDDLSGWQDNDLIIGNDDDLMHDLRGWQNSDLIIRNDDDQLDDTTITKLMTLHSDKIMT